MSYICSSILYLFSDVPIGFPKFVRPPQTQSADVGKRIQLQCEAEGAPDLKFVWLKNGVPIKSNQQGSQALGYRGRYSYDGSYSGSNIGEHPTTLSLIFYLLIFV